MSGALSDNGQEVATLLLQAANRLREKAPRGTFPRGMSKHRRLKLALQVENFAYEMLGIDV